MSGFRPSGGEKTGEEFTEEMKAGVGGVVLMPTVLRDPGVGETLEEYYVEVGKGMKIKIRLAEVLREDGSIEHCCFADEPPLTALDEQIYAEALREIGPRENILGVRKREDLYLLFKENLRKVASRLKVDLSEEQESKLLYYLAREIRHSILEPFMLDENMEEVKVVRPGLEALVVHKDCRFLGWLKTNAVFTDPRHLDELIERFVKKARGPTNPSTN
jgi:hypothetical protein